MNRSEVMRRLQAHREELGAMGVRSLALFGSTARGEARPDSDVDILVEFDGTATFDQYTDLLFFLQELLGSKIDLVTRKGLRPRVRGTVEAEALYVA